MDTLFGSIAAGIGDVCAGEDTEKKEHLFRVLQFTYFWLYGFTAICFWHLYNVFIAGVWLHDTKWLLPDAAVALIVINYLASTGRSNTATSSPQSSMCLFRMLSWVPAVWALRVCCLEQRQAS